MKTIVKSGDLLRNIVKQTGDNVLVTDANGKIEYVNAAFEKTTGYKSKEVIGKNPRILKSGHHKEKYYKSLWSTILSGKTFKAKTVNKSKKGELFVAQQTISPIFDSNNRITHFVSVWKDITKDIEAEKKLRNLKDLLQIEKTKLEKVLGIDQRINTIFNLNKLVDFLVDSITLVLEAEKCSIMFVDEQGGELRIKGYKGLTKRQVASNRQKLGDPIAGVVAVEGKAVLVTDIEKDKRFSRKARPSYKGKSFVSAPIKLGDNLIGVVSVTDKNTKDGVFDALDLKILSMIVRQAAVAIENAKMYRQLNYLTVTDPITNMNNYRYFVQKLDYELERLKRYSGPLCLLMIDVDNFKQYNDQYGHLEGDKLLKKTGEILENSLRKVDVACRYAGDEFVVILPETNMNNAKRVANKIKNSFNEVIEKRKITLSIGIAKYTKKLDRKELIFKADNALYQAKKAGKNQIKSLA